MDAFTMTSLVASIVSVVLAGFAIWLAMHQKREADKVNKSTTDLLVEIRTDAKSISNIVMPELQRYGEFSRQALLAKSEPPSVTVEKKLDEQIKLISDQVDELRKDPVAKSLKGRLDKLESQIVESKKQVSESVREAVKGVLVTMPSGEVIGFDDNVPVSTFIAVIADDLGMKTSDYSAKWWVTNRITGQPMTLQSVPKNYRVGNLNVREFQVVLSKP
jgi:hypothetical protein